MNNRFSRRTVLKGSSALALTAFAAPVRAQVTSRRRRPNRSRRR